jgi:hypothetical protein
VLRRYANDRFGLELVGQGCTPAVKLTGWTRAQLLLLRLEIGRILEAPYAAEPEAQLTA